jgi:2Fe-2S ferredoxin
MPVTRIVFVDNDGQETAVDGTDGLSVMEVAIENDIEGILAECGGACACATCHVFVDKAFRALTGEADEMEEAMLEFNENTQPNSRLSCQIEVRVATPESQI